MGIEKNVEDCLVLRINQFVPKRVDFDTNSIVNCGVNDQGYWHSDFPSFRTGWAS